MFRKRLLTVLAVSAILIALCATTAFAHGGGHHGRGNRASYAVCTVDGCNQTARHTHNGVTYAGHYLGDGCGHATCTLDNCTRTDCHEHDGATYYGHCATGSAGCRGRHHS